MNNLDIKVSIITVSLNSEETIEDTIKSVLNQSYKNIEYLIIDGASTDKTVDIIKKYADKIAYWVSEKDESHYHAMNKGIKTATGDIIGILNSDDMYIDNFVIENVVKCISENGVDSCYGDLVYVDRKATDKIIRYWKSGSFYKEKFRRGWMPPHPTFFVKKEIYEKYGFFNTNFGRTGDYELMFRFLYKFGISAAYIPKVLVKMRTGGGGRPSLHNTTKTIIRNYRAWKINGITPNPITFIIKPLSKISQFPLFNPNNV